MTWKDEKTLCMRLVWNTTPFIDDVTVSFDEQGIVLNWERNYSMDPNKAFQVFGWHI